MAYIPPSGDSVNFMLESYDISVGDAVDFSLGNDNFTTIVGVDIVLVLNSDNFRRIDYSGNITLTTLLSSSYRKGLDFYVIGRTPIKVVPYSFYSRYSDYNPKHYGAVILRDEITGDYFELQVLNNALTLFLTDSTTPVTAVILDTALNQKVSVALSDGQIYLKETTAKVRYGSVYDEAEVEWRLMVLNGQLYWVIAPPKYLVRVSNYWVEKLVPIRMDAINVNRMTHNYPSQEMTISGYFEKVQDIQTEPSKLVSIKVESFTYE